MDFRNILFILVISLLLFGTACAQKTVNDFKVDESYEQAYGGNYHSLYINEKQLSGIAIYRYMSVDVKDNSDIGNDLVHDNGKDYLIDDEGNITVAKNPDKTVNFTDKDYAEHGIAELVICDGEQFVVVFWAKDISGINDSDLISELNQFNSDNNVKAIAF